MAKKLLTNEQLNILNSCAAGAGLAADIAHAQVTIYVREEDPKYISIYGQTQPWSKFVQTYPQTTGKVRLMEEPLVGRVLQRGVIVAGRREWALGMFAYIKIFPLFDARRNCFGAIAFESKTIGAKEENVIFIDCALKFLLKAEPKLLGTPHYQRLHASDGLLLVDTSKVIVAANDTAKHIFSVLGIVDLVGKRTNSLQINWPLIGMVLKAGVAESKEFWQQDLLLALRVLPLVAEVDTQAAVVVLSDITELRKKDEEILIKTVVIKEIHHRVKNNLQTVASLLRLQARRTVSAEAKAVLEDSINRVNSIALVHEFLSQQDSEQIAVAQVAQELCQAVLSSMVGPELVLHTTFEVEQALLSSEEAISFALVLNELLQNAVEHGFKGRSEGNLAVEFQVRGGDYVLEVRDDGVGLPTGFALGATTSLGLKIIQTLTEVDWGGKFTLLPLAQGTCARITLPVKVKV
ncbi:MAG: sensor histidine kinase [Acidaminococcaceae bacterium]